MGADMKTQQMQVRVFVVDDHPLVVEGMRSVLAQDPAVSVVGWADSIAAARDGLVKVAVDVVLIDERLPDGSGIDLIGARGSGPQPWFVMVTGNDNVDCVRRALESGARGYLLKDIPGARLLEAVHAVARGEIRLDPRLSGVFLDRIRQRQCEPPGLTWRDRQVLSYLADGLTNVQISERMGVSPSTAKTYVTSLFGRLGVETRAAAVGLAARHGLLSTSDSAHSGSSALSTRPEVMVIRR